jgi:signal transduction histidine kinase
MTRRPWLLLPGIALAALAAYFASMNPRTGWPLDAALAGIGVLLVWNVALAVRARYPERPLWRPMLAVTLAYALQPLVYSTEPVAFALGRAARPLGEIALIWLMLAFPTGRLATRSERAIVAAALAAFALLWLPAIMLAPRFPPFGPFAACVRAECPDNVLFVADYPAASAALLGAFRIAAAAILVATSVHLLLRLRRATALMRRALAPVVVASLARALNIAVFLVTGMGLLALTFTLWAVPLAIALGLLRGRIYTARALQRLVGGLRRRPHLAELRDVMAEALEDPSLAVGTWDAARGCWIDAAQGALQLPAGGANNRVARVLQDADRRPVAVLVHDAALLEEPMLIDAVASSMHSALASLQLEAALAGERAQSAVAVEEERRRIERDLHDGAQQRLLALRMKLGVSRGLLRDDARATASLLAEMDGDIGAAIGELRALAHGIAPPLLAERGLPEALADAARHAAIPVAAELPPVGRIDPAVERAVYFCCVEALQNAAKHAGPGAAASLELRREGDTLSFRVADSGSGTPPSREQEGHGIHNMRERLAAVGGRLSIERAAEGGLRVAGSVPVAPVA